jgi:arylformamidase
LLEIIDISAPVKEGMVTWPGLLGVRLEGSARMERGDRVNVTDCHFCAHTGTHVDAPYHHYRDGIHIDEMDFTGLLGKALVLDLTHVEKGITASDLEPLRRVEPFDILVLKTRNSTVKSTWQAFDDSYIYLEPEAADQIRELGICGVAIDCLGIEKYGRTEGPTHKKLLRNGAVTIIEGVDLRRVEPGYYWFACLPLKLVGADGAPARAILIRDPEGSFLRAWQGTRGQGAGNQHANRQN